MSETGHARNIVIWYSVEFYLLVQNAGGNGSVPVTIASINGETHDFSVTSSSFSVETSANSSDAILFKSNSGSSETIKILNMQVN